MHITTGKYAVPLAVSRYSDHCGRSGSGRVSITPISVRVLQAIRDYRRWCTGDLGELSVAASASESCTDDRR